MKSSNDQIEVPQEMIDIFVERRRAIVSDKDFPAWVKEQVDRGLSEAQIQEHLFYCVLASLLYPPDVLQAAIESKKSE